MGPDAKPGRHVVWVRFSGQKSVIGSLTLGGIEQFQIDFPVSYRHCGRPVKLVKRQIKGCAAIIIMGIDDLPLAAL